jgi:hypothetical protein
MPLGLMSGGPLRPFRLRDLGPLLDNQLLESRNLAQQQDH